jgi:hypothetical protein
MLAFPRLMEVMMYRLLTVLVVFSVIMIQPALAMKPRLGVQCTASQLQNGASLRCEAKGQEDAKKGLTNTHFTVCLSGSEMMCCVKSADGDGYDCNWLNQIKSGGRLSVPLGNVLQATPAN